MTERADEALILAGGLGTRLRTAAPDAPKALAPANGRPFLEYLMDYWLGQGVRRFVLSVGWRAEKIIGHFGREYRGAPLKYVREEEPLGTGGALALALRKVEWRGGRILALNGDTWLTASLDRLNEAASLAPVVMALLAREEAGRYGGVELDGRGLVRRFGQPEAGPPAAGPALINAGCYLLEVAPLLRRLAGYPPKFSLEGDFLAPLAAQGLLGGLVVEAEFIDIGVPEDYRRFAESRNSSMAPLNDLSGSNAPKEE